MLIYFSSVLHFANSNISSGLRFRCGCKIWNKTVSIEDGSRAQFLDTIAGIPSPLKTFLYHVWKNYADVLDYKVRARKRTPNFLQTKEKQEKRISLFDLRPS